MDIEATVTSHQSDQQSKYCTLDHTSDEIADQQRLARLLEIVAATKSQNNYSHPIASKNPGQVREHGEARNGTEEREHTRKQKKTAWAQCHGAHGIEFFGDNHRSEFSSDSRSATPGHNNGGEKRRHFP